MNPNQHFILAVSGFSDLWNCLFTNAYPQAFLANVLGLSSGQASALPRYLLGYVVFYLLCGAVTILLRFKRGQRSLNSRPKQINNVILTMADFFFIPQLPVFVDMGKASLGAVTPYSGEISDVVRFFSEVWTAIFTPLFLFLVVLFTVILPFQSAIRYLRAYKLAGLPHMVFDVGTGCYLLSAVLLSMCSGNRLWYLLIPVAVILLWVVQTGGYIPEEQNLRFSGRDKADGNSAEN